PTCSARSRRSRPRWCTRSQGSPSASSGDDSTGPPTRSSRSPADAATPIHRENLARDIRRRGGEEHAGARHILGGAEALQRRAGGDLRLQCLVEPLVEIGRASCRERVASSVVAVASTKKQTQHTWTDR